MVNQGSENDPAAMFTEGAAIMTGALDQTFMGFSIKLWILLFLILLIIFGHKKQIMPWNTPPPAQGYYW